MSGLSRAQMEEKVAEYLCDPRNESRSADEMARQIVSVFHEHWYGGEDTHLSPVLGMVLKMSTGAGPYVVRYMDRQVVWLATAAGRGGLYRTNSTVFRNATISRAKIKEENDLGVAASDVLSDRFRSRVLAVAPKAVLAESAVGCWDLISNADLEKYYLKGA